MKKTPLYDLHIAHGAKMGAFAGYDMPLFFAAGIMSEHQNTREKAGLFDICHMMQVMIEGPQSADLIARLCPLDPSQLGPMEAKYTFFLNDSAGIIDDLIVTKITDTSFYLVCNAGRADVDWAHIETHAASFDASATILERSLIALQGPLAVSVLEDAGLSVSDLTFMTAKQLGDGWQVSRSGYTGEDGYELSIPTDELVKFCEKLLADERVLPVGLGARDSLRLEAGLSLYGQDLNEETTPMEAGLTWAIAKDLRTGGPFVGSDALVEKIAAKRSRKRIGLVPQGRAPVRSGAALFDKSGDQVGEVTSGGFGPTVGHPVALALINVTSDIDTLEADVRGKRIPMSAAKLPFTPHNYKR